MENGWEIYSKMVLGDLKRINDQVEDLATKVDKLSIAVEVLKVKSTIWGAVAGSVPGFIAIILFLAKFYA